MIRPVESGCFYVKRQSGCPCVKGLPSLLADTHVSFSSEPLSAETSHSLFPPVPVPVSVPVSTRFQQYFSMPPEEKVGCSAFSSNPQSTASPGIFSKLKESHVQVWTANCSHVKSGIGRCTKRKETQILNEVHNQLGHKSRLCLFKLESKDLLLLLGCHSFYFNRSSAQHAKYQYSYFFSIK